MNNLTKIAALPMAGGAMAALPAEVGEARRLANGGPVKIDVTYLVGEVQARNLRYAEWILKRQSALRFLDREETRL